MAWWSNWWAKPIPTPAAKLDTDQSAAFDAIRSEYQSIVGQLFADFHVGNYVADRGALGSFSPDDFKRGLEVATQSYHKALAIASDVLK